MCEAFLKPEGMNDADIDLPIDVDVVIPIHSELRPISRAVGSVFEGTSSRVRVIVACHNVRAELIRESLGTWGHDPRVTLISVSDGVRSPAGPLNAGLDVATGQFVALLDSDDEFEPGAIDAWLAVQRRTAADIVIVPEKLSTGAHRRTPPVRWPHRLLLEGVKDRLAYRTRQRGLVNRERFSHVRMTPGLPTGEDVIQGMQLWYSSARITYAHGSPAYVLHVDGDDRVTGEARSTADSLRFLDAVLHSDALLSLNDNQRAAFGTKLLRTHILDLTAAALDYGTAEDFAELGRAVSRILEAAPEAARPLSRVENGVVTGLRSGASAETIRGLLAQRYNFRRASALLPKTLRHALHREAPLRLLVATALTR